MLAAAILGLAVSSTSSAAFWLPSRFRGARWCATGL